MFRDSFSFFFKRIVNFKKSRSVFRRRSRGSFARKRVFAGSEGSFRIKERRQMSFPVKKSVIFSKTRAGRASGRRNLDKGAEWGYNTMNYKEKE